MQTFLNAKWQNIVMVNYEIDPNILIPYLPCGLEIDVFEHKTFVSLVGFLFKDSAIFGIPIPYFGTFEEINLRFYVVRKHDNTTKRGVVFINETVPNKVVAWVANKLYKEHYIAVPTKQNCKINSNVKHIEYSWKVKNKWNKVSVNAQIEEDDLLPNSIEEFIFENYFGYTKLDNKNTLEYKINHPSWKIYKVNDYEIDCDFEKFYGIDFAFLKTQKPNSVLLAKGSEVTVDWKRTNINNSYEKY